MSNAIMSGRTEGRCGICFIDFTPREEQWTHEGAGNHDGFHKDCLRNWCKVNSICPVDRAPINLNSLFSKAELFFDKAKRVIYNSVTAGVTAAAVVTAGSLVNTVIERAKSVAGQSAAGVAGAAIQTAAATIFMYARGREDVAAIENPIGPAATAFGMVAAPPFIGVLIGVAIGAIAANIFERIGGGEPKDRGIIAKALLGGTVMELIAGLTEGNSYAPFLIPAYAGLLTLAD